MPQRATSTSFKPGHPPTPGGGRPKQTPLQKAIIKDLKAYARQYTEEAMQTYVDGIRDKTAPLPARQVCADRILERGYGKPKEVVEKTVNVNMTQKRRLDISNLSEEQLDALEAALRVTNMLMIEGKKEEDSE
jgi:hypothetical protein